MWAAAFSSPRPDDATRKPAHQVEDKPMLTKDEAAYTATSPARSAKPVMCAPRAHRSRNLFRAPNSSIRLRCSTYRSCHGSPLIRPCKPFRHVPRNCALRLDNITDGTALPESRSKTRWNFTSAL